MDMKAVLLRGLRCYQSRHLVRSAVAIRCRSKFGIIQPTQRFVSIDAAESVAKARSEEIFQKHVRMPNLQDIPSDSLKLSDTHSCEGDELALEIRRKRLVYRCKQRGWLEVDLLLGTWANENVSKLNAEELDQFEDFVNLETIDIYNVITLRMDVPENLKRPGGSVVERIQEWARSSPLGKADPDQYKEVKQKNKLI